MPLASTWSENATCDVQSTLAPIHASPKGKFEFDAALVYLLVAFLTSTIVKGRWPQELSKRGREALFRLDRFGELKPNWDSYNAEVPSRKAMETSEKFIIRLDRKGIPPYFVSPGPNGDVMVQYKCDNGHEAEIWFEKDGSSTMLLITPDNQPYEAALDLEFLLEHLASARAKGGRPAGR
jgi:hypothetical protein